MPATEYAYSGNETTIYNRLKEKGLNTAAICGILANLDAESGFNPKAHQKVEYWNSSDASRDYTKDADAGISYANSKRVYVSFTSDSVGYGIVQWTYSTRKQNLLNYAKSRNTSVGDLSTQISFMLQELESREYESIWDTLKATPNTEIGAYNAAYNFCMEYEKPYRTEDAAKKRGDSARTTFWKYYSSAQDDTPKEESIGDQIVRYARRTTHINKYADSADMVYKVYNTVGVSIPPLDVKGYYSEYKDTAKKIANHASALSPGDLLFYVSYSQRVALSQGDLDLPTVSSQSWDIAIATGDGGRFYFDLSSKRLIESSSIGSPDYVFRILSDSDTGGSSGDASSGGDSSSPSISAEEYNLSAQYDAYNLIVSGALARIADEGYEYGYLIDMDHGGEFKFYVPDFTESAGANWNPIDLPGRSVQVFAYGSTNSRVVNISLELYAGEGVYKATDSSEAELMVEKMHRDLDFVKSLEYPDYSNVISRPPATVLLVLGASFNLEGVVSNVSVENMKPVDEYNRSMYAKLSFTVTQTAINPPDYRNIRAGYHSANAQDVSVDMWRIVDMPSQPTQPGIVTESANGTEIILPPTATIGGRGQIKKNTN